MSLNINDAYLKAKDSIEIGEIYKYDNFYLSGSISEVISSKFYAYKINRIKATGNFLKIPFSMVDWPNNMSPKLRKELWESLYNEFMKISKWEKIQGEEYYNDKMKKQYN